VCAGKTILLVLQALRWLRQGDVHVISVYRANTLAASRLVERQLKETIAADVTSPSSSYGNVIFHSYDLVHNKYDVDLALDEAVLALQAASGVRPPAFIVDELFFDGRLVA
jgi:hypothetical protein